MRQNPGPSRRIYDGEKGEYHHVEQGVCGHLVVVHIQELKARQTPDIVFNIANFIVVDVEGA